MFLSKVVLATLIAPSNIVANTAYNSVSEFNTPLSLYDMAKYTFDRLGSDRFETLAQALLEKRFRTAGSLVQFGVGKDGGREATWTQKADHPDYVRPKGAETNVDKEWVFQAKYHDVGTRGWDNARADVEVDLQRELDKIVHKHEVPCDKYILITNVPFTGVRHVGTRDRVNSIIREWQEEVPEIEVWDAVDLSRMLDADPDTRTTYLDEVLPGDVLRALLRNANFAADRRSSAFRAYLTSLLRSERDARAEEAGDESGLKLEKIFVDLNLQLATDSYNELSNLLHQECSKGREYANADPHLPLTSQNVRSSFAFLRADSRFMLLKGGPGVGKSTITQFLTLFQAARLLNSELLNQLASRLKLTGGLQPSDLEYHNRVRFPLRIELRRYAQWISKSKKSFATAFIAQYVAEQINLASSSNLDMDDIFDLASRNPLLLILDGLDEVPNPNARKTIFDELEVFLDRCAGEECDIQVILSSRPQGYRGEFSAYQPVEWHVIDLERNDFDEYVNHWIAERIPSVDERFDAKLRIDAGMKSLAVQEMAKTLLQATVMLTIASRKYAIPHARHKLYEKYVEVIFERERVKDTVRNHGEELKRLHELVGFRLMEKMELEENSGSIQIGEFERCIQEVIKDFGPLDLGNSTIAEVIESILMTAKDRLCLLIGKGDEQEEFDFAIQQFREYFAAAYLHKHDDADPEKVYVALVSRQHVWAQVLQFYAAFQNKAQQKLWIFEADGKVDNTTEFEELANLTRVRRTLMRILPEFERPRNEYVQRAINNIFDRSTLWTWLNRIESTNALNAFAQDESFNTLERLFTPLSLNDATQLSIELNLLVVTAGEKNLDSVVKILQQLLDENVQLNAVLSVAMQNKIQLELSHCSAKVMHDSLRTPQIIGSSYSTFYQSLSIDHVLDLVFLYQWMIRGRTHDLLEELNDVLFASSSYAEIGLVDVAFAPSLEQRGSKVTDELLEALTKSKSQVAPYLKSLLLAIKFPFDPKYYYEAAHLQVCLSQSIRDDICVESQLGAPPSNFDDQEAWCKSKELAYSKWGEVCKLWLSCVSLKDLSWLTLWTHPETWDHLKHYIPSDTFLIFTTIIRDAVKEFSPKVEIQGFRANIELDTAKILECILTILENHDPRMIHNHGMLQSFVFLNHRTALSKGLAELLLRKAIPLGTKLDESWAAFLTVICSSAEDVDLQLLQLFWKRHWMPSWTWYQDALSFDYEPILQRLLSESSEDSVLFAAFLMCVEHNSNRPACSTELQYAVSNELCKLILQKDSNLEVMLNLLLRLPAQSCELKIWSDLKFVRLLEETERWSHDSIAERIKDIAKAGTRAHQDDIRGSLGTILTNHNIFPIEISVSALDALLEFDEVSSPPLEDNEWQIDKL